MSAPEPLIDGWPVTVEIGGEKVRVDPAVRVWALICRLLEDERLCDAEKGMLLLPLAYPDGWPDGGEVEAFVQAMRFMRLGADPQEESAHGPKAWDLREDWSMITAAFMQAYGIDPCSDGDMHWWLFISLLRALPEDTAMGRVMGYRTAEISADLPEKQQEFLRRQRARWRLNDDKGRTSLADAVASALQGRRKER